MKATLEDLKGRDRKTMDGPLSNINHLTWMIMSGPNMSKAFLNPPNLIFSKIRLMLNDPTFSSVFFFTLTLW